MKKLYVFRDMYHVIKISSEDKFSLSSKPRMQNIDISAAFAAKPKTSNIKGIRDIIIPTAFWVTSSDSLLLKFVGLSNLYWTIQVVK